MSIIVFIDKNTPQADVLSSSIVVPYYDFSDLSVIDLVQVNRIGFIWENNFQMFPFGLSEYLLENGSTSFYFSNELISFFSLFKTNVTIDLITCELGSEVFIYELNLIKELFPNIIFNYSVNLTGNPPYGDWIMESSGEDIKLIYFNDNINNFTSLLLTVGEVLPSTNSVYTNTENLLTYQIIDTSNVAISNISSATNVFGNNITGRLSTDISFGFNFPLKNQTYSVFRISTSGAIFFGSNGRDISNATPSTINSYPCLLFMYGNMVTRSSNGIRYLKFPTYIQIQADLQTVGDSNSSYYVQITIYSSGKIEVKYEITRSSSNCYVAMCDSSSNFVSLDTSSNQFIYSTNKPIPFSSLNGKTLSINRISDLSGPDYSNLDLSGYDFSNRDLSNTIFRNSNLTNANFSNSNLLNSNFTNATLTNANFTGATFTCTITGPFTGIPQSLPTGYRTVTGTFGNFIIGPSVDLSGCDLLGCNLSGCITGSLCKFPRVPPVNYKNITLGNGLRYIIGPNINLSNVDLSGTDLSGCLMTGCDLSGCRTGRLIEFPNTLSTNYQKITLSNGDKYIIGPYTILRSIDLSLTDLSRCVMNGSDISGSRAGRLINFPMISPNGFYNVIFINNNRYMVGPNTILTFLNMANGDLSGCNMSGCDLTSSTPGPISNFPIISPNGFQQITLYNGQKFLFGPNTTLRSIDLSGTDLSRCNLSGCDISGSTTGSLVNFPLTNPSGYLSLTLGNNKRYLVGPYVNFAQVDLSGTDLSGCNLTGCNWTNAITGPLLNFPSINTDKFRNVTLGNGGKYLIGPNIKLRFIDLSGTDLSGCNLTGCDITGSKTGSLLNFPLTLPNNFRNITLGNGQKFLIGPYINLRLVDLSGTDLSGCNLNGCDLNGSITGSLLNFPLNVPNGFRNITLGNGRRYLIGPNLNLSNIDLSGTDLSGCNLSGCDLSGSITGSLLNFPSTTPNGFRNITLGNGRRYILGPNLNLSNIDLSGTDLSGVNLSRCNLNNATLGPLLNYPSSLPSGYRQVLINGQKYLTNQQTNQPLDISNTDLSGSNYAGQDLSGSKIVSVNLTNADLSGANLTNINFRGSNLTNAIMTNAIPGPLQYYPTFLPNSNYSVVVNKRTGTTSYILGPDLNMKNANISNYYWYGNNAKNVSFASSTNLNENSFIKVNFEGLQMSNNTLEYCIYTGCNLKNANLSNTIFRSCFFTRCDFTGANLTGTQFINCRIRRCTGL